MPDRKTKSGIEAHFKDLDSQRQRCDAAAAEKQRKIDGGKLLDLDREAARSGVDLTGKNPDDIVAALSDAQETDRAADPYMGDSAENLMDAHLNARETYGAKPRSGSGGRRGAKSSKRRRGRSFRTKECEPRIKTFTARGTESTSELLCKLKAETKLNNADLLLVNANLFADFLEGKEYAKIWLRIVKMRAKQIPLSELKAPNSELLSVTQKGWGEEAP